jgi:hypothetical protein
MTSKKLLVFGLTAILSCQLAILARAMTADEAAQLSKSSGRPLLIVAGRHTCGLTNAVLGHLKEPELAPALSPYVNIFVDVDEAEGRDCQKKFGSPGTMLPFVYVIRADGEKLYSHSGILQSDELRDVLLSEAAKAGRSLSARETALVKKALEDAKRAQKKGDLGEAVKSLLPLKKIGPLGSVPCFTGPGAEANKLVAQLTNEGKAMLKEVDEKSPDGKPTLDAALTYAKAKRAFAALPTLKTELAAAARKYERRRAFTEMLAQAEALDRAQAAAASPDNAKKAADAFKKIIATYPDTEAAGLAAEQLKKLSPDGGGDAAADDAKPAYRTWTDTTGQFRVKARYAGVSDEKLSLETEDGRKIQVPLEKLSETDRNFLKSQRAKE